MSEDEGIVSIPETWDSEPFNEPKAPRLYDAITAMDKVMAKFRKVTRGDFRFVLIVDDQDDLVPELALAFPVEGQQDDSFIRLGKVEVFERNDGDE